MKIIKRNFYLNKISTALKSLPIITLIGARQVGKTTLMKSLPISEQKIFLNGQDPDISEIMEIDFIVDNFLEKIPFEVKYKQFSEAKNIRALTDFMKQENCSLSYLINMNQQSTKNKIQYIPGIFLSKIKLSG